jgi:GT2 family glycosyltransferase
MDDKVAIIVLNYNGKKTLLETLQSLSELNYQNKEILVVDNASEDDSFLSAQEQYPQFRFLGLERNGGFAWGMNRGIEDALERGASYIWLFNYDAVAKQDSLMPLVVEAKKNKDEVLLSPVIYTDADQVWFSGGRVNYWRMRGVHEKESLSSSKETEFLTGCALFIPKKVIERVGLLDERFFLYYEDVDFSLRAKKEGIKRIVVPAAQVVHSEESQSSPNKIYFLVLSGLLFFDKHKKNIFSFYQAIYVILRVIKNTLDFLLKKPQAGRVRGAYSDFYVYKRTKSLPYFCKLQ